MNNANDVSMSDGSAGTTKVRLVSTDATPPEWARSLFNQVAELQHQIATLRVSASILPYPDDMTPDGLARLAADSRLPDFVRPLVRLIPLAMAVNDAELLQASKVAYDSVTAWINTQ